MMAKTAQTPDSDWQRIWFSTRQHEWTSLALVPSDAGIDVARIAEMLANTGRMHGERQVGVIDASGVQLGNVQQMIDAIGGMAARGEWTIVPVDPIEDNPAAIAILRVTSAALLVVRLGESLLASAERAIEIVGRERFLGSVVLEEGKHFRPSPQKVSA
jgi:hypothetical protein